MKSLFVAWLQELRVRLCPILFVAFSGGTKASMYKVFEVFHIQKFVQTS